MLGTEQSSSDAEITIYNAKATTIQEALRLITRESPKKLHLANLEMLVICEGLAMGGIENILDFFIRNTDANNEFYVVIAKGENKAGELISILTPIEKNPTISLKNSIETYADRQGSAIKTTASYALDELMKKYKEVVLSTAEIIGNPEEGKETKITESSETESKVLVSNVAYFKDDAMKGYLSEDEAKVYNIITNDIKNLVIVTKVEEADAAFEVVGSKCKTKLEMNENIYNINICVEIKANLSEIKMKIDTNKVENIEKLENALRSKLEDMINSYLDRVVNEYKADISGFGQMLYKKYGNKFEVGSEGYLDRLKFNVEVKVSLENEGSELISR